MSEIYDAVIIGAGPSGSTTAHYLAKEGFNVLLLDKFNFPRDKTCGDGLTPRALQILDDMGILDTINQVGYRSNKLELISPKGHTATAPLPKKENLCDYLLVIPRLILDNIILERAMASGANFQAPVRVMGVEQEGDTMFIKGEQGAKTITFRARMVIHATGANTKLLLTTGLLKKMPQMILTARTYYDGITSTDGAAQCRLDNVPLPGYGWVFPVSATSAGKMAAEHLSHMFAIGDFSVKQLAAFDKLLRKRYQQLFVLCDRLRLLYLNHLFVNHVVRAVARSEELMNLFMNIAVENQNVYRGLAPGTIAKVIFEGMPGR